MLSADTPHAAQQAFSAARGPLRAHARRFRARAGGSTTSQLRSMKVSGSSVVLPAPSVERRRAAMRCVMADRRARRPRCSRACAGPTSAMRHVGRHHAAEPHREALLQHHHALGALQRRAHRRQRERAGTSVMPSTPILSPACAHLVDRVLDGAELPSPAPRRWCRRLRVR